MTLSDTLEDLSYQLQIELDHLQSSRFSYEHNDKSLEFVFLDSNNFWVPFLKVRIVDHDLFRVIMQPEGGTGGEINFHELRILLMKLAEEIFEDETRFDYSPSVKGLGNRHEAKR